MKQSGEGPEVISVDVSEIHPSLWQGGRPPAGPYLATLGFTHLVLCAHEYQFDGSGMFDLSMIGALSMEVEFEKMDENEKKKKFSLLCPDPFPGVVILRCPFEDMDDEVALREHFEFPNRIVTTAREVAAAIDAGGRVAVTCAMGLNRSGLVVGTVLHLLTGWDGRRICERIRARRGTLALCNVLFSRCLRGDYEPFVEALFGTDLTTFERDRLEGFPNENMDDVENKK